MLTTMSYTGLMQTMVGGSIVAAQVGLTHAALEVNRLQTGSDATDNDVFVHQETLSTQEQGKKVDETGYHSSLLNHDVSSFVYETPFELSSLNGANGFQINGILSSDNAGNSVSSAGDLNGDGYADLIIGASSASPNGRRHMAGESYVVFGQSRFSKTVELSQLNGANGFQINGISLGDEAGWSVRDAGDVNGDGYADLIIGALNASPDGRTQAGESYVIFGQSRFNQTLELSQLNGADGFQVNGISSGDCAGTSVSGVGDVNGDGYADLIIGAPFASPSGHSQLAGKGYVVFGQSRFNKTLELSQLNGDNGFQVNGIAPGDESGYAVSGAGDVNGDGYPDIIIGAFKASPGGRKNAGESYVVFGQSCFNQTFELSQLNGVNGFQLNGIAPYDWSGSAVSGAGDVNGDGYADLIIGAINASPSARTQAGESYVVFGQSHFNQTLELSQLNGADGFQINGISDADNSGWFVSGAGDVNGDGYADLIIGALFASPEGRKNAGESYVVFGQSHFSKTLELSQLNGVNGFQLNGIASGDESGNAVSGAGDVNGDGYADLIIGAPLASPSGRLGAGESYVVFGGQGTRLSRLTSLPISKSQSAVSASATKSKGVAFFSPKSTNAIPFDAPLENQAKQDELRIGGR